MSLKDPTVEWIVGLVTTGAILKLLPAAAALVGVIYYVLLIWESPAGGRWRQRWRGLYYRMRGVDSDRTEIEELKKRLEDIRRAREDHVIIAVVLGLGGAGIGMAMIVILGGIG